MGQSTEMSPLVSKLFFKYLQEIIYVLVYSYIHKYIYHKYILIFHTVLYGTIYMPISPTSHIARPLHSYFCYNLAHVPVGCWDPKENRRVQLRTVIYCKQS